MKKTLLIMTCLTVALSSSAFANAHAKPKKGSLGGCNFTDRMYIQAPVGSTLLALSATGLDIQRHSSDPGFNIIGHCESKYDGTVTATIGTDSEHAATLTIRDGQFMMNPEITNSTSKGGYYYSGTDHSLGSYTYTLKFNN